METGYVIAGKRFQAEDVEDLNRQLSKYNLVSNLNNQGLGNLSVRRVSDNVPNNRYSIVQSYGDSADFDNYDVIVGKLVAKNCYGGQDVAEVELSELEKILDEVKKDIPDLRILVGCYWS